jgi:drug/metabolite transporter (DMT)-like permease
LGTEGVTEASRLAALAAALAGVQVGAAMVATRFVVDQTGPASLALLRYAIGFCCLLAPALLAARVRFATRDLIPIAFLGIVQFGVVVALLNVGLRHVSAGRAALIFATFPLLTMLFAAALGREKMTLAKSAGVALTIAGVAFALGDRAFGGAAAEGAWLGEAAVLASAASGALCSVLYRPYLRRYPVLGVSAFAMLASVGFLAVLAAGEGFFDARPSFTPAGWLAVVFIGLSSGVGYWLWLWALGHTTPTRATVFLALSPITAAVLGALLLGERASSMLLVGLACVVAGLWLAHRPARQDEMATMANAPEREGQSSREIP